MRAFSGALGVLALCLVAALLALWPARPALAPLRIGGDFRLIHESGEALDTNVAFADRPMLVYFGYTYCPDVCPTTLIDMVVASEATAVDEALIFVSLDPERDTPAVLRDYTELFSPALEGFTGSAEALETVTAQWAIYSARHDSEAFSEYLLDHTTLVFLTDARHRVVEVFKSGTSAADMTSTIAARFD